MFRWNLMLRTLFGVRYDQAKARQPRKTVKLHLERLEDRTVPSALGPNPLGFETVASPPPVPAVATLASPAPVPSVAVFTSSVFATVDHWFQFMATAEQEFLGDLTLVTQEFAQLESSVRQQVGRFLGNNSNAANPALNTTVTQPGNDIGMGRGNSSGSGSGSSASTTHNLPNQPLPNSTPQSGRGSGSGSSSTTNHPIAPTHGGIVHPMTSGTGSGGGGSGSASVYGYVWQDCDYDGLRDNGEGGYYGATVSLVQFDPSTGDVIGEYSTTTSPSGYYQFTVWLGTGAYTTEYFEVQVAFPFGFFATQPGVSQIDANGYTQVFALNAGDVVQKNAGISSMNVNTLDDDANNQKIQDMVTLRDAIQAGNDGAPQSAVTFYAAPNKVLSGTISLKAQLDPIKNSYNIGVPLGTSLTVNGNNNAGTIFSVNAGVTSTISELTITGGSGTAGGGVLNKGTLTLSFGSIIENDATDGGGVYNSKGTLTLNGANIANNDATDTGGGVYNSAGANLFIYNSSISGNTAGAKGGGLANLGDVHIGQVSVIQENVASDGGAGVFNGEYGQMRATDGSTKIHDNFFTANSSGAGGGVDNSGYFLMDGGSIYNNKAQSGGGGLANGGTMILSATQAGLTIYSNQANSKGGGGIYTYGGKLTINSNVTIGGNVAADQNKAPLGGGLYLNGGTAMVAGAIEGNLASGFNGGGIYVSAGKLTIESPGTVNGNTASGLGGGMYINGGTVKVTGASFYFNQASGGSGGGIYVNAGSLSMTGKYLLTENKAPNGRGGGMLIAGGKVTLSGGSIQGNTTGVSGGGIYNSAGSLTIQNGAQILSNDAKNEGGGMYLEIGSTTTFGNAVACTIAGNTIGGGVNLTKGMGVYRQYVSTNNKAIVNNWVGNVVDKQDPGGLPVSGP